MPMSEMHSNFTLVIFNIPSQLNLGELKYDMDLVCEILSTCQKAFQKRHLFMLNSFQIFLQVK